MTVLSGRNRRRHDAGILGDMARAIAVVALVLLVASACRAEAPERRPSPGGPTGSPAPEATEAPAPPEPPPLDEIRIRRELVATLEQPLAMAVRRGDDALYVAERTGRVRAIRDGTVGFRPVVDLSGEVSLRTEQGLLGLAFSPDGRFLYVNYTDGGGDTHVTEFRMDGTTADPDSRRDVVFVPQPFANHNGGNLVFGPDGYLYIGLGDGGSAGDPLEAAQSLERRLGKMLRVDPRPSGGRRFGIPDDNPFVGRDDALPEIWAYGLRNPWRYSFDRETGDLWIGDVGQGSREEIDFQPARSGGGENYGWDHLEGRRPFEGSPPPGTVPPLFDYGRDRGASVIGGYVYRGEDIPDLRGTYVFGDFYNRRLMALRRQGRRVAEEGFLAVRVPDLASFGEDADGELYALSLSGGVYRLTA